MSLNILIEKNICKTYAWDAIETQLKSKSESTLDDVKLLYANNNDICEKRTWSGDLSAEQSKIFLMKRSILKHITIAVWGSLWSAPYQLITCGSGERGGSVVECRTPEREVRGSRPTAAVLCPWARHFTPRKYWLITQEAMAPSRHDWKNVDWDVKPQHNQPTNMRIWIAITKNYHQRLFLSGLLMISIKAWTKNKNPVCPYVDETLGKDYKIMYTYFSFMLRSGLSMNQDGRIWDYQSDLPFHDWICRLLSGSRWKLVFRVYIG